MLMSVLAIFCVTVPLALDDAVERDDVLCDDGPRQHGAEDSDDRSCRGPVAHRR
jgi:hypothetical protein